MSAYREHFVEEVCSGHKHGGYTGYQLMTLCLRTTRGLKHMQFHQMVQRPGNDALSNCSRHM